MHFVERDIPAAIHSSAYFERALFQFTSEENAYSWSAHCHERFYCLENRSFFSLLLSGAQIRSTTVIKTWYCDPLIGVSSYKKKKINK